MNSFKQFFFLVLFFFSTSFAKLELAFTSQQNQLNGFRARIMDNGDGPILEFGNTKDTKLRLYCLQFVASFEALKYNLTTGHKVMVPGSFVNYSKDAENWVYNKTSPLSFQISTNDIEKADLLQFDFVFSKVPGPGDVYGLKYSMRLKNYDWESDLQTAKFVMRIKMYSCTPKTNVSENNSDNNSDNNSNNGSNNNSRNDKNDNQKETQPPQIQKNDTKVRRLQQQNHTLPVTTADDNEETNTITTTTTTAQVVVTKADTTATISTAAVASTLEVTPKAKTLIPTKRPTNNIIVETFPKKTEETEEEKKSTRVPVSPTPSPTKKPTAHSSQSSKDEFSSDDEIDLDVAKFETNRDAMDQCEENKAENKSVGNNTIQVRMYSDIHSGGHTIDLVFDRFACDLKQDPFIFIDTNKFWVANEGMSGVQLALIIVAMTIFCVLSLKLFFYLRKRNVKKEIYENIMDEKEKGVVHEDYGSSEMTNNVKTHIYDTRF